MNNRLFIVDDHSMLKNGLKNYLETNTNWIVSGTFANGSECLSALKNSEEKPEIIIVDIQLTDGESGFSLVKELKNHYPEIKIVMYSMYDTWGFILQAKDLGVQGYISKVANDEELVRCLSLVQSGASYYEKKSESIQSELESITGMLKKQEKVVFEFVLQGKTKKQIADMLFISLHTVENYVSYLIKLSGCKNLEQVIEKYK